jgi:hypothetical protein
VSPGEIAYSSWSEFDAPLLPVQYYGLLARPRPPEGEFRLMLAVLEDAIRCYLKNMRCRTESRRATAAVKDLSHSRTCAKRWKSSLSFCANGLAASVFRTCQRAAIGAPPHIVRRGRTVREDRGARVLLILMDEPGPEKQRCTQRYSVPRDPVLTIPTFRGLKLLKLLL